MQAQRRTGAPKPGDADGQRGREPAPARQEGVQDEGLVANGVRHVKRGVVLVVGSIVLLGGVVMLVTPGPGIVGIALGLGILATEFTWARRLLHRFKERFMDARDAIRGKKGRDSSKHDRERTGPE